METILVATDFSERSDIALARAAMIARKAHARLHLVHVVDDDQKPPIVEGNTAIAEQMLQEETGRLQHAWGLDCIGAVVLGDPFEGIARAADAIGPELVVIGAHRRRLLRDVFVGTTAQRTIRRARWPVLMVNAPAERDYANVLVPTDLSAASRKAARHLATMELARPMQHTLLHVIDAPPQRLLMANMVQEHKMERYLIELKTEAEQALAEFGATLPFGRCEKVVRHQEAATSVAILDAAREMKADLIVVASQGRVGLSKTFLGSVAEEVLRRADRDVLAIPPDVPG